MNQMTNTRSRGGSDFYRYCVYGVARVSDRPLNRQPTTTAPGDVEV